MSTENFLQHLASLQEEMLQLKKENAALKKFVEIDPLTGLLNHVGLKKQLDIAIDDYAASGSLYSLLFLDLDYFKQVNEDYGHIAASHVLALVGQVINQHIEYDDHAFRYGGDEFIVLLKGGQARALKVAESIRKSVDNSRFAILSFGQLTHVSVTVSVGVCVIGPNQTAETFIEKADQAMFEAKRRSRNCLMVA